MARILHIEDDRSSRRLVEKLLGAAGHEVIDTADGLEGLRLAREVEPDLILVDINIPNFDGYEVTLRLRGSEGLRDVPIVAITAEGDPETSLAVGADGFISKPIDPMSFCATVESYLGEVDKRPPSTPPEARLRVQSQRIVEKLEAKVQELAEANRELEETSRLRREFLRNVSHELATPMTPVVGYIKLLLEGEMGELTELQRKCLLSIARSTRRLRRVTDTLLDVSALEMGRMHYYERGYDFGEIVKKAIHDATQDVDEGVVELALDIPSQPLIARGDPDKLCRALVHMIDNAIKYSPRGGTVACAVTVGAEHYSFSIADSGPGVGADERQRILEPFYQVDGSVTRRHGGVGLGLAFARRVAIAQGGSLRVQSPPGVPVAGKLLGGTLFEIQVQKEVYRQPISSEQRLLDDV